MDLEHSFTVDAPIAEVWSAFLEPDRVAPCFPGATLTGSDATSFTGTVKVKLGPIAMLYKGTGQYVDTDESTRKVVIKANGKDSRGNGQANATVTMTLTESSPRSTGVVVLTDLSITGKPAQLGRGIIAEVGGKISGQFADCLGQRLGAEAESVVEIVVDSAAETPEVAAPAATNGAASPGLGAPVPNAAPPLAAAPKPRPKVNYPPTPDAIDLLDSGGSAVAKRVAPVAAGVVLGGLLVWLITRS